MSSFSRSVARAVFLCASGALMATAITAIDAQASDAQASSGSTSGATHPTLDLSVIGGILQPPHHPSSSGQTPDRPDRLAGFFSIQNSGPTDQLLQNITSSYCQKVTVNHSNQEALETGDPSEDIFHHLAIPHQATMVFPREGYHLLCYGFRKNVPAGSVIPFVFHFLHGAEITADFTLQPSFGQPSLATPTAGTPNPSLPKPKE